MVEQQHQEQAPAAPAPRTPAESARRRRLPMVVRYLIVAFFGAVIAAFASYLLRTIGY